MVVLIIPKPTQEENFYDIKPPDNTKYKPLNKLLSSLEVKECKCPISLTCVQDCSCNKFHCEHCKHIFCEHRSPSDTTKESREECKCTYPSTANAKINNCPVHPHQSSESQVKEEWEEQISIIYGQIMRSAKDSQRPVSQKEAQQLLKDFISHSRQQAVKEEREEIVKIIEAKKGWYSGGGNQPIRDALDSIISKIKTSK